MSLKIINGARIEELAEKLVEELKAERTAKGRFEFLKVAVANPNLGNWLKMKVLAKEPELSAGVELPFLDEMLAERVKASYAGGLELISGRDYPPIILDALMNHWRKEFVPFRKYVKEEYDPKREDRSVDDGAPLVIKSQREARKAIQLAERLAELIDGYEATGSLGTLAENKDKNDVFRAEQALVETLFGENGQDGVLAQKGRISLRQMFEAVAQTAPQGESKIVLFGLTSLTAFQLKMLEWVSRSTSVIWYYPGQLESRKVLPTWQEAKAKLHQSLKETFGDRLEVVPAGKVSNANTCLEGLQVAINGEAATASRQDASVQVVGAPGIRREIEMVYNAILGAVWAKNADGQLDSKEGMSFSDVAVMVADMPKYRHMIEAVFDGRGQIPYGLVDATTQDYSTYLDGFLALMNIARYGLSRKRVFDVLENPCVQRAMGFSRDDVIKWLDLAQRYGAYDGYKEKDSDEKNASGHFNWEWALRRMRLGLVANDLKVEKGRADVLPLEADDAEAVCRFSEVVETLWRKLDSLNHIEEPVECSSDDAKLWEKSWAGRLHAVMDEFLAVDKDDSIEALVRAKIVRTLNSLKVITGPQSFKLPVAVVEHTVAGTECAKGGYLRHGVTIGSLRSLAHVPFKQIFVVGLGEGGLPGKNDRSTLDVRNVLKPEERLDVLRPEENRARFLAAVLSARDRLVLSYPNRELGSDAKLYPSSLVNDLKDACKGHVTLDEFKEFEGCPLVESAEHITTPEGEVKSAVAAENVDYCFTGLLPTFSERAYVLAGRKQTKRTEDGRGKNNSPDDAKNKFGEPSPKDLAEFVKDPFTAILKRRLGIATEGYRDHCVDDASPLGVPKGPVLWKLQEEIAKGNFETAFPTGQCEANIPCDFLGEFAKSKLDGIAKWASSIEAGDRVLIEDKAVASDTKAVVCRSFEKGTDKEPIDLCPEAVLEPLFKRFSKCDVRKDAAVDFTVKVINVEGKNVGIWRWTLSEASAANYYNNVCDLFKECLSKTCKHENARDSEDGARVWSLMNEDGRIPSLTYGEFRNVAKNAASVPTDDASWAKIALKLICGRNDYAGGGNSFNSNPVISKIAEKFEREPTGDDLKRMYEKLYSVPMTGALVVGKKENGGAE